MYAFVGGYDKSIAYRRDVGNLAYIIEWFHVWNTSVYTFECSPIEVSAVVGDGVGVVGSFVGLEQLMVGLSEGCCLSERLYLAIAEDKVA